MSKRFADALLGQGGAGSAEKESGAGRLPLATCVVLLEAARIDNEFSDEERAHIVKTMGERFALSEEEATELLREAVDARENSTDLFRFTRAINEGYSTSEKLAILEEVWRIFYSDGTLDGHEDHLARKLQNLLNVNHPQLIAAKMKVLDEIRRP